MHAEEDQLRIGWNPALAGKRGRLEIVDGAQRATLPLSRTLANATYTPQTGDVEVRLLIEDRGSTSRGEIVRVLCREPQPIVPSPEVEQARAQIADLEARGGGASQRE